MKRIAVVLSTLVALGGCKLQLDPDPEKADAGAPVVTSDTGTPRADGGAHPCTVTVRGRVCTRPTVEQVKIQFLVDQSGSMCVTDGPGSQSSNGFCEMVGAELRAKGVTVPARVRSLKTLMQHLAQQDGVFVALVPFDVRPRSVYPLDGYVPASDTALTSRIDALQNDLGKGTDYQGALAHARERIERDIAALEAAGAQALLAHTRYVTVLLSDGVPYPRCSAHDDLAAWASVAEPNGTWQDNPAGFCNGAGSSGSSGFPDDPECLGSDCGKPNEEGGWADAGVPAGDAGDNPECLGTECFADAGTVYSEDIPDFALGGDRNQNAQLFAEVDRMVALQSAKGVAEIRLDTVMLSNSDVVALCGAICESDLYNYPGTPKEGRQVARWTTEQLALHGRGGFHEYADPDLLSLGWIDTMDVGRPMVAKEATPFARRFAGQQTPEFYAGFPGAENPILPDADGDGFPDAFETAHASAGFDPNVADARGCKSVGGVAATFVCVDADGDGLSEPMEAYLGANPYSPDTDADGIPDGVEVDVGLDPTKTNAGLDGDGDQAKDVDEVLKGSDPAKADAANAYAHPAPQVTAVPQADGTTCYDFVVQDVWLNPSGFSGRNYLVVPFAQVPQGAASHAGAWRQACAFAIAPAPGMTTPDVVFADADFVPMARFGAEVGQVLPADFGTLCKEVRPR